MEKQDYHKKVVAVVHGRDLDGYCCGAIIKAKHPHAKVFEYDYGQKLPEGMLEMLDTETLFIIADVSFEMENMHEVCQMVGGGENFVWVDHHITQIKKYNQHCADVLYSWGTPVFDINHAACHGLWKYLFPGRTIPFTVQLLSDYDVWNNKIMTTWNEVILPFQYGMRNICNSVDTFPLGYLSADIHIKETIDIGNAVLKYQKLQNERACKNAFEMEFQGLRAICLNTTGFNSMSFESIWDEDKYDIMMPFAYTKSYWTVSLYTTKDVNCGEIARKLGGGGHRKAAGFQTEDIHQIFPNL